jgi:hypothetical protein
MMWERGAIRTLTVGAGIWLSGCRWASLVPNSEGPTPEGESVAWRRLQAITLALANVVALPPSQALTIAAIMEAGSQRPSGEPQSDTPSPKPDDLSTDSTQTSTAATSNTPRRGLWR